ncbi:MAG: aminotransferase class IV [Cyclobacteriaceae bacterium]
MINGELRELHAAEIPATDLTLRRGYGLFDFFRVHDGTCLYLEHHIQRLFRGIDRLRLDINHDQEMIMTQVKELVAENHIDGITGIRIVVTGGVSPDGFTPAKSNVIITQESFKLPPDPLFRDGTALMTHAYKREIADVKSLNYMMAVYLAPEMHRSGATEVLYHFEDRVSECTRSNVFCISKGKLYTPVSDVLAGITRGRILDLAAKEMETVQEDFSPSFLMEADEVFISSTIKRIIPVVRINDIQIGAGVPGPLTRSLMKGLRDLDQAYLTGAGSK